MLRAGRPKSLDLPNSYDEEGFMHERIPDPHASVEDQADVGDASGLGLRLSKLVGERAAEILSLRFGLNGGEPHTLAMVGERLGVSKERIRQLEDRAIVILRRLGPSKITQTFGIAPEAVVARLAPKEMRAAVYIEKLAVSESPLVDRVIEIVPVPITDKYLSVGFRVEELLRVDEGSGVVELLSPNKLVGELFREMLGSVSEQDGKKFRETMSRRIYKAKNKLWVDLLRLGKDQIVEQINITGLEPDLAIIIEGWRSNEIIRSWSIEYLCRVLIGRS